MACIFGMAVVDTRSATKVERRSGLRAGTGSLLGMLITGAIVVLFKGVDKISRALLMVVCS